jgi:endonuclease YncB( thermonuclease family)
MDYVLIKGSYHVVGYSPDGDSLMFRADNPALWQGIPADNPQKFQANLANPANAGAVQLRLQGLDAPETHFTPSEGAGRATVAAKPVGGFRQPGDIGRQAATALLALLGVTNGVWKSAFSGFYLASATVASVGLPAAPPVTVSKKLADQIPGYIVTRDIEQNGRPVAWVFPGSTVDADGAALPQDALAERVERSVNFHLLAHGLAYPYFYMTLQGALRAKLATAAAQAQAAAAGSGVDPNVWRADRSTAGLALTDITAIVHGGGNTSDGALIWPYLFRKVLKHWYLTTPTTKNTAVDVSTLCAGADPNLFVASSADFVKLDEILDLSGGRLRLKKLPQDIVFLQ